MVGDFVRVSPLHHHTDTHRHIIVWWFTTHTHPTLATKFTEEFHYESILISEHELQSQFLTEGIDLCLSGLQKGTAQA